MTQPIAYTMFHLNMAFSSIEEEERPDVIKRCYWPLLELARSGHKIGLEATGYTLRIVQDIDPEWINCLRSLIAEGKVEFVGSGYVQMIAPLAPPEMTKKNLILGQQDYQEILNVQPKVYLLNEQAYAPGILPIYADIGAQAIIMDCSEPSSRNASWKKEYAYRPQYLEGADNTVMPVIWSDAISFQKFQRYAHGEIDADEYFDFLSLQINNGTLAFPLYTSDAEVFDYRPGRFSSEASLGGMPEYERIALLLRSLSRSGVVKIGAPSDTLSLLDKAAHPIKLESPQAPIPVKKQRKYNILRWAVTGRNDLALNTQCWRIFERFLAEETNDAQWRELAYLWASDLRTHITVPRWQKALKKLSAIETQTPVPITSTCSEKGTCPSGVSIKMEGRFLVIQTDLFHLALNCGRGLTIQSFGLGDYGSPFGGAPTENGLIGTLAHGFYGDIAYGADFYSGHYVCEPASKSKVTDLVQCEPEITYTDNARIKISATLGDAVKTLFVDTKTPQVVVHYSGSVLPEHDGSFRCGHITLNPRAFDPRNLYFSSHNGGIYAEKHYIYQNDIFNAVDHGAPVSRLVSASNGVGMTSGTLEFGDGDHYVRLSMERKMAASIGLVTVQAVADSYFVRGCLTLAETDDTYREKPSSENDVLDDPIVEYSIAIGRHGAK